MAGEVQLKLQASLDLAFLRSQLASLGSLAKGYNLPIVAKLDTKQVDAAVKKVSKEIRININDSQLDGLTRRLNSVKQQLDTFKTQSTKIEIGVTGKASVTQGDARKIRTGVYRGVMQEGGKILLPVGLQPISQSAINAFKADLKKKLGSININVNTAAGAGAPASKSAGFQAARQSIATLGVEQLRSRAFTSLGRESRSAQQVSQWLDTVVEQGLKGPAKTKQLNAIRDFLADSLAQAAGRGVEARMGGGQSPLQRNLDTFARGLFRMLGMDPTQLKADRQARLAPPAINWPAQVPQRRIDIGPSSTGRALPQGAIPGMLPGTSYVSQKRLVGDILSPSLKEALRGAANAFVDVVRRELNSAVRQVSVRDLGVTIRGALPPGATPPSVPMLPAAGGSGGYFGGGRRPGGGFVPPGGFPSDGMATGPQGPKNMLSLDYYKNAFKYAEALKVAQASARNFTAANIPLLGGLRGIASEFGEATKQVLLYGTAYKGLAFITSLPGQILNAAKSQQQFNNAMQVATQASGTYAKELLFVDNVQRAFGLDLETTRTGFTRLYASMSPAGFDSGSIEKLFTGISAATAALQLTPDRAERVIYAFGQMASKGQVMSEELKGQLGDVLPGALAIFASAAGKSVKEFNKEIEDGIYSGGKFRDLMAKVTDELISRFGTGAQAAGKSLQGLTNVVRGDFTRTLEAFAPLANSAAQAFLLPLSGALRQLSTSAQIATGEMERIAGQIGRGRQDIAALQEGGASSEQIKAAEKNVAALEARYNALNQSLKDPAVEKQVNDIQRLTVELGKAGTFVMNVASGIGSMLNPVLRFLGANLTTVISLITSFYIGFQTARLAAMALMGVLLLYRNLSVILGFSAATAQATVLAGAFNMLGVSASAAQVKVVGLRLALTALVATTVIGAVVAGIVAIAGAFATMRDRANEAAQSSRDAAKAAVDAAAAGNVAAASMGVQGVLAQSRANKRALETLNRIYARSSATQRKGAASMALTPEESTALMGSPLTKGIIEGGTIRGGRREIRVPSQNELQDLRRQFGSVAGVEKTALQEAKAAEKQAQQTAAKIGLNVPTPGVAAVEPAVAKTAEAAKELRDFYNDQSKILQSELEGRLKDLDLRKQTIDMGQTEYEIEKAQIELTHQRLIINEGLRVALAQAAKENLSASDRQLKIDGLRKQAALDLANAEKQSKLDIGKARLSLESTVEDSVLNTRLGMEEQKQMLSALGDGYESLSPDVRAYLDVQKLTAKMSQFEVSLVKEKIEAYAALREEFYRLEQQAAPARMERELQGRLLLAGSIAPADELRARLKQQLEYVSPDRVEEIARLTEQVEAAEQLKERMQGIASSIGDSFGEAFKNIITGTSSVRESLAGMFRSIADSFADMVGEMISQWLRAQVIGLFKNIFSGFSGGLGSGVDRNASILGELNKYANGGIAPGGFKAFASGGIVTGPTLGLVGEGRYNEAVVPLPDGKSIPVDLGGLPANGGISTNIVVNVSNGQANSQTNGSQGNQLARELEGAVRQVILKETRPGGVIYSAR